MKLRIALVLMTFLTFGCADEAPKKQEKVLTDGMGRKVVLPNKVDRVVSLAASLTEVMYAIKAEDKLVSVTQNSDYPASAKEKPIVNTWPNVNFEKIVELDPDLVIGVESLMPIQVAERIEALGYPVYFFKYSSMDDVFEGFRLLGKIIGNEAEGNKLADSLKQEFDDLCSPDSSGPKVVQLISLGPIYAHGPKSFINQKILCAGGVNAIDASSTLTNPQVSREYFLSIRPDIIFGFDSVSMQTQFFDRYPELKNTKVYKNWDCYDLSDYGHSRPAPRIVKSTREMKQIISRWKHLHAAQ